MDVSLAHAAQAYASRMQSGGEAQDDAASDSSAATGGTSFTDVLSQTIGSTAATMHKAEALQMQAATGGKVDVAELVTAVASAELSLNTVVAIRDRVISAYQSIIGMAI